MPTDTPPEPLAPTPSEAPPQTPTPEIDPAATPMEAPDITPMPDDGGRPLDG